MLAFSCLSVWVSNQGLRSSSPLPASCLFSSHVFLRRSLTCDVIKVDPGQADQLVLGSESARCLHSPNVLEGIGLIVSAKRSREERNQGTDTPGRVSMKKLSLPGPVPPTSPGGVRAL